MYCLIVVPGHCHEYSLCLGMQGTQKRWVLLLLVIATNTAYMPVQNIVYILKEQMMHLQGHG